MNDEMLTARQVAELLGVSTSWVLRQWRAGRLPGFKLSTQAIRFRRSEIEVVIEERRGIAPAPTLPAPQLRAVEG